MMRDHAAGEIDVGVVAEADVHPLVHGVVGRLVGFRRGGVGGGRGGCAMVAMALMALRQREAGEAERGDEGSAREEVAGGRHADVLSGSRVRHARNVRADLVNSAADRRGELMRQAQLP
jgi:hypothetical protein